MLKGLWNYLKKYAKFANKQYIIKISTISVLTIIISIFTPALTANIITSMLKTQYRNVVTNLILLALFQIIKLILTVISTKLFYVLRKEFIINIKNSLSKSILNLDMQSFNKMQKGRFIQRINKDPDDIADLFNDIRKNMLLLFTNIGIAIYIIYLNWVLGIIYSTSFILILYIRKKGVEKKRTYKKQYLKEEEHGTGLWSEILNGIKEIKLLNVNKQFSEKTEKTFEQIENYQYKADFTYTLYAKLTVMIEWIANTLVIITSIYLIKMGYMGVNEFVTIFMYRVNLFSFVDCFTDLLDIIARFNLSSSRIFDIIDLYKEQDESKESKKCFGKIEFKNVKFKYDDKYVLNNCSFVINANEKVAIIGGNGSGKTTILNLIARTYKNEEGKILIDDIYINELSEKFLRDNITMISQDFYIFNMSIKENLLLANLNATDNDIQEVCKKVELHKYIESLPEKYETMIGENGVNLSGGQRQRIAIARALLKKSKIILLDEVTSSLDENMEKSTFELLEKLKSEHTIVVVTHNLKYIENFEKKYMLKNGEIVKI